MRAREDWRANSACSVSRAATVHGGPILHPDNADIISSLNIVCEIWTLATLQAPNELPCDASPQALCLPAFEPGWVWLAGAGPGDPGLITVARTSCGRECRCHSLRRAGQRGAARACANPTQNYVSRASGRDRNPAATDISRTLVSPSRGREARVAAEGRRSVRVRTRRRGIALALGRAAFRSAVPGVTAGIGGLAYAGIPVTHRDTNHAVTLSRPWRGRTIAAARLARDRAGLAHARVLYGAGYADEIAAHLIAAGRCREEPAAIVGNATPNGKPSGSRRWQIWAGRESRARTVDDRHWRECEPARKPRLARCIADGKNPESAGARTTAGCVLGGNQENSSWTVMARMRGP